MPGSILKVHYYSSIGTIVAIVASVAAEGTGAIVSSIAASVVVKSMVINELAVSMVTAVGDIMCDMAAMWDDVMMASGAVNVASTIALNSVVSLRAGLFFRHVAHQNGSLVGLVRSPTGLTVRSHSVAANITIGDTVLPVFVPLVEVNERSLIVVGVRHRRAGVRVRDVMATVVITTVHSVVQVLLHYLSWFIVLGLVDGAEGVLIVVEFKWLEARQHSEDRLVGGLAGAVGADTEEVLNFVADDGPLGGVHGSLPAAEVVVDEELVFVTIFALGEHGVDQEDGRLELFVSVIDGLHVEAALEQRPDVWLLGEDGVLDSGTSVANREGNQLIALEMLRLLYRSLFAPVLGGSEVG